MTWQAALEDFAAQQGGGRSSIAYLRLVACLWDQGLLKTDAQPAVPAVIEALLNSNTPNAARARLALLLGLLAEGRDDGHAAGRASSVRAAVRQGVPRYLAMLGNNETPAVRLALIYLLAHFPEDTASILADKALQTIAGTPAAATLERVLRFQEASSGGLNDYAKLFVPDETAQPDEARSQVRTSFLAPLGAEAHYAIEHS